MFPVLRTIRILVIIQIFENTRCQDGFGDQNLRLHYTSNDEKINSLSFNANSFQRDPNIQSMSSSNGQFSLNDDTNNNKNNNNDFGQRLQSTRHRKVYRIKNPFQNQFEDMERQQENTVSQDSGAEASNQYESVQYSLPPEEFLQQLRSESQYYQQTQISTPAPNLGYTATPLPQQQYQYSTIQYSTAQPPYDSSQNQQNNNQIPLEPKSSQGPTYLSSPSSFQYSTPNTFLDNIQSTPSPMASYLSTPLNNGQYSSQPSAYLSSDSSVYVSSPSNQQSFVSSPLSITQAGSHDYNNRVTSSIDHNLVNFDKNEYSSSRYPIQVQQQYQNEYSTTTTTTPSPYSEQFRDLWQNNVNSGYNTALKPSPSDSVYNQYQNYPYQITQQDAKLDTYADNVNSDTHRVGSIAAPNNMFLNYIQSNSPSSNSLKHRARDLDHDTSQTELYSNGDFGWKLEGKKPLTDMYSSTNYNRYSPSNIGVSDGAAVSQMNFHMGSSKPYNYNQISKSATDTIEQEFAQAAAKAHERLKQQQQQLQQQQQQQQQQQYFNINSYGTSNFGSANANSPGISYYSNIDKQKNKYSDSNSNYYSYGNSQNDLITASPYLSTPRENLDNKSKQPFDHDKALKNIVSIDVSNVVGNADPKAVTSLENSIKYGSSTYGKDHSEQNVRQYIRPVTDSFYKDKNAVYGFNIKTKGDDYSTPDTYKQQELQTQESNYNRGFLGPSQSFSYLAQPSSNYHDSLQSPSVLQPGTLRSQNQLPTDIASILKFGDIPYKLTQGLSTDTLKVHNLHFDQGGIPSPLPQRLNQNVGSHQIDVTTNLLNKLLLNKQPTVNLNKPEIDSQSSGLISTINGFKVANPFNMDLKLVAELLKGKSIVDNSHMLSLRDQYTNPSPLKLDLNSQLQFLLKNENNGNLMTLNDGLSAFGSPFIDIYSNNRYPYQKFSRSQEEEESIIPIAKASNTHPIGAVVEQDDTASEREVSSTADITAPDDDVLQDNFEENRPKTHYLSESRIVGAGDRPRHPNILMSGRHSFQRKFPKSDVNEPYPLLKPPPRHHSPRMGNGHMKMESKYNRRRRVYKPKLLRVIKTEPLFEAGAEVENLDKSVSIVLRPPSPVAEAKSDTGDTELTA